MLYASQYKETNKRSDGYTEEIFLIAFANYFRVIHEYKPDSHRLRIRSPGTSG